MGKKLRVVNGKFRSFPPPAFFFHYNIFPLLKLYLETSSPYHHIINHNPHFLTYSGSVLPTKRKKNLRRPSVRPQAFPCIQFKLYTR